MGTASEVTQDSGDLDKEYKRLSILGKLARNSLFKLTRDVAEPAGEWYDKQGKLRSHHIEQARRLSVHLVRDGPFTEPRFLESIKEQQGCPRFSMGARFRPFAGKEKPRARTGVGLSSRKPTESDGSVVLRRKVIKF